ncbi:hypothetical protein HPB49_001929 [Dermacentor silvarum]|uniref:Uncharacterized protein n=1 Tax=Dermacentor silvarum TaxID=543639 RepID=A0ACB8DA16_DERSI|nr:hypothetical protein HPB49_001929 [Dermacentor silvarum]
MLQEKARQFAHASDITGFEASTGWLHRFHERNGITWQVVSGEKKSADVGGLLSLLRDYRANARVWMTRHLFSEWVIRIDDQMKSAGRKILIIAV